MRHVCHFLKGKVICLFEMMSHEHTNIVFVFSPHVSPVFFKVFSHFPRLTCRVLRFQPPAAGLKRQAKRKMEAQDKAQAKSLKAGTGGGPSVFFGRGGECAQFFWGVPKRVGVEWRIPSRNG